MALGEISATLRLYDDFEKTHFHAMNDEVVFPFLSPYSKKCLRPLPEEEEKTIALLIR